MVCLLTKLQLYPIVIQARSQNACFLIQSVCVSWNSSDTNKKSDDMEIQESAMNYFKNTKSLLLLCILACGQLRMFSRVDSQM